MKSSTEIRTLTDAQLDEKLRSLHQESFNLRFQLATAQLENTARIGKVRREIARVLTIKNERSRLQNVAGKEN